MTTKRKKATTTTSYPALPLFASAAATYLERREVYGDGEQRFAHVMAELFPDGLTILTHEDWVRYGLLFQAVGKICRYAAKPGHIDSAHDLGVYAFMLEAEDRKRGKKP